MLKVLIAVHRHRNIKYDSASFHETSNWLINFYGHLVYSLFPNWMKNVASTDIVSFTPLSKVCLSRRMKCVGHKAGSIRSACRI